jgi:hypothetical protein
MTTSSRILAVADVESSALEAEFERFETAWRSGSPPDIEQFSSNVCSNRPLSDSARQQRFLAELVAIDLEHRWRATSIRSGSTVANNALGVQVPDKPRLEDYLRKFPVLASGGQLPIDLIGLEYRARVLWGDTPNISEYLTRFAAEAGAVRAELARIDHEISECGFNRVQMKRDPNAPTPRYAAPTVDSDQESIVIDEELPLPERIARFEVIEVRGSGGFGIVYRAFDPDLQREVAIKVPRRECVEARGGTAAYLAEARTIAMLDHSGIVPVYEMGCIDDGRCYVVTKLMPGADLAQLIAASRPDFEPSAHLVACIAEALHHAHARGVVHRDIKPANILLDAEGNPLIVDFGLAMREDDFGSGPGFLGTLTYMSPEQAQDTGHLVDARTDIFSLGVVLFELLTGKSPYRGKSKRQLVEEIAVCDPRPVRQIDAAVPHELDRICQKARATRPADRYATAQDFANDLRAFLHKRAKTAMPRWAVPVAVGSVAVLAVVAIGAYWLNSGSNRAPVAAPAAAPAPQVALSAPYLDMDHVVRDGDDYRFQAVTTADVPLPDGDRVALDVHLLKGEEGFLYLFQYDEGRAPKRLWPLAEADLARQKKIKQLRYPGESSYIEVSSESGRTMIVAAVSSTPLGRSELTEVERVAFSFDDGTNQKPFYELVFPADERRPALRSKAPRQIVQLDPVRLRSSPQRELQRHFDAFTALVFSLNCSEPN